MSNPLENTLDAIRQNQKAKIEELQLQLAKKDGEKDEKTRQFRIELTAKDHTIKALREQVERLGKYADHKSWCNSRHNNAVENNSIFCECDCGFSTESEDK